MKDPGEDSEHFLLNDRIEGLPNENKKNKKKKGGGLPVEADDVLFSLLACEQYGSDRE